MKTASGLRRWAIGAVAFLGSLGLNGYRGWASPTQAALSGNTLGPVDVLAKLHALTEHRSQWVHPIDGIRLQSFIKSEEVFWTGR